MAHVMTPTNDADEVQRQMREVRAELRDDVKELVVSAHEMTDWKRYVRAYPWLCVGGALAAGFLIIPQRSVIVRPDAEGLIELAKRNKLVVLDVACRSDDHVVGCVMPLHKIDNVFTPKAQHGGPSTKHRPR